MTGQRYIGGALDDNEQYIQLMDGGVNFAKEAGLTLGEKPTAAQLAKLKGDIG